MTRVLSSADWGGPALSLIANNRDLDPLQPVVMYIRHTERQKVTGLGSHEILSTSTGRVVAFEFGSSLPANHRYRLYHTVVERAKETAEGISEGIKVQGGSAQVAGEFPFRASLDPEATDRYLNHNLQRMGDEAAAAIHITNLWCAGLTPPETFRPSGEFARMVAGFTLSNLKSATPDTVDIYVSHDTWVGCLMFHWFGVPVHPDGVKFMDGFLLQPNKDDMTVWFRGKRNLFEYPHWWRQL